MGSGHLQGPLSKASTGRDLHLPGDSAATSDASGDPFVKKTRPLSAGTSAGALASREIKGRKHEAQTSRPGRRVSLTSGERRGGAGRRPGSREADVARLHEDTAVYMQELTCSTNTVGDLENEALLVSPIL